MKNYWIVFLLGLVFLPGCDEDSSDYVDGEGHYSYKEYLIDAFISVDELHVVRPPQGMIKLSFSGSRYRADAVGAVEKAEFERLAATHGGRVDRKMFIPDWYAGNMGLFITYTEDFSSLEVRTDKAWDASHPAGSLLNDITTLVAYSYAEYVRGDRNDGFALWPVTKIISELQPGDLDMLAHGTLMMYFMSHPVGDSYNLTVTFTTRAGRKISANYNYSLNPSV